MTRADRIRLAIRLVVFAWLLLFAWQDDVTLAVLAMFTIVFVQAELTFWLLGKLIHHLAEKG